MQNYPTNVFVDWGKRQRFTGWVTTIHMEKIQLYLRESYQELVKNVSWPTWANLQANAVAVVVAVLLLAAIVFLMDVVSKFALDLIYGI